MTERICEYCGKQFVSEVLMDKVKETAALPIALFLPLHAIDCFREGWHGILSGLFWLFLAAGACYDLYDRGQKRKGKVVKFGLTCPSCGERSAEIDSPLGEQLIEYWSAPQEADQQDIVGQPSAIPGDGEEADTVVSHIGSACE